LKASVSNNDEGGVLLRLVENSSEDKGFGTDTYSTKAVNPLFIKKEKSSGRFDF
jgi:hypothetical protein